MLVAAPWDAPLVVVVGAGSWGLAFAGLASTSARVRLVCRTEEQAAALDRNRCDANYLPEFVLPDVVELSHLGVAEATDRATLIVLAAPSKATAELQNWLAPRVPLDSGVLSLAKGLDPDSGERLSSSWQRLLGDMPFCVLAGPNHAEEVAAKQPTATVVAGNLALAARVQELLSGPRFRVYLNDDLVGVEIAAAAKNVIALAAGMSDGLGFGDNAKASLVTRGLAEMTRLGLACGARDATFRGLAGMGDLVATCTSRHSRNRRAGEMIATGTPAAAVEGGLGQVAEGLGTARNLLAMAQTVGVDLPICREVVRAAFGGAPVEECLNSLMSRAPGAEE